jgi:hypothetical protein
LDPIACKFSLTPCRDITDRRGIARQLDFAGPLKREAYAMTNADYRDMASEIRDLIPLLVHPEAVADLRLLADRYEKLAQYLEAAPGSLPDAPLELRRQAG